MRLAPPGIHSGAATARAVLSRIRARARSVLAPPRPTFSAGEKGAALQVLLARATDLDLMEKILETRRFSRPVTPTFVDCPEKDPLVFLAPHHDDEIIGCGGLILHAARQGKTLVPVYVTDGMNSPPGYNREEVPELRKQEARRVWGAIGGIEPVFLDHPNKAFTLCPEMAAKIRQVIEAHRPGSLFVPFFLEDPDTHRKTNHLLYMACRDMDTAGIDVWAYQVTSMICPNVGVEMSGVALEKRRLMEMWETQNAALNYPHYTWGLNIKNSLYYRKGDVAEPQAELFFVVPLAEYLELLGMYYDGNEDRLYGNTERY